MELDEAVEILTREITTDSCKAAIDVVKSSIQGLIKESETYRFLYEGLQKRLMRFRDVASRPDIHTNVNVNLGLDEKAVHKNKE